MDPRMLPPTQSGLVWRLVANVGCMCYLQIHGGKGVMQPCIFLSWHGYVRWQSALTWRQPVQKLLPGNPSNERVWEKSIDQTRADLMSVQVAMSIGRLCLFCCSNHLCLLITVKLSTSVFKRVTISLWVAALAPLATAGARRAVWKMGKQSNKFSNVRVTYRKLSFRVLWPVSASNREASQMARYA